MARVTTYLNFAGNAEEAMNSYAEIFGTEFEGGVVRMGDMAGGPDGPQLTEAEKNLVGHAVLPILAGHVLMASDLLESMGHELRIGNTTTINLEPDSPDELERLYAALSDGGSEGTGLNQMPWGLWGATLDRFGIRWMFNYANS